MSAVTDVLTKKKDQILQLCKLQDRLRSEANAYLANNGKPRALNQLAAACEKVPTWKVLRTFIDREGAIVGGESLANLCVALDCVDLGSEISKAREGLNEQESGLSIYDAEIVELVFKIRDLHDRHAPNMKRVVFARIFSPYEEQIVKIFALSREGCNALGTDQQFRLLVENAVALKTDEITKRLKDAEDLERRLLSEYVAQVGRLVHMLRPYYQTNADLAKDISLSETTIHNALRGSSGRDTYLTLIKDLEKLVAKQNLASKAEVLTAPPAAAVEQKEPSPLVVMDPRSIAGATTADGVRYAITADSFHVVHINNAEMLINFLITTGEQHRQALILLAQADPAVRRLIMADARVSNSNRETYYALMSNAVEIAQALTQVFDNNRKANIGNPFSTTPPHPNK